MFFERFPFQGVKIVTFMFSTLILAPVSYSSDEEQDDALDGVDENDDDCNDEASRETAEIFSHKMASADTSFTPLPFPLLCAPIREFTQGDSTGETSA